MKDKISPHTRQMLERILQESWVGRQTCHRASIACKALGGQRYRRQWYSGDNWYLPAMVSSPAQGALGAPAGQPAPLRTMCYQPGRTPFFRQLDHLIATCLQIEDFSSISYLTQELLRDHSIENPPPEVVKQYRTQRRPYLRVTGHSQSSLVLSYRLEAQILKSNCMLETSGGMSPCFITWIISFLLDTATSPALYHQR
jgi:hypothetical protein